MTAKTLYEIFLKLCPLTVQTGVKYYSRDTHSIEIMVPGKGKYIFEYYNDKKWRFEHL